MNRIRQQFSVSFSYDVSFTEGLFNPSNSLFSEVIGAGDNNSTSKILFVLDQGMYSHHPGLFDDILTYHHSTGSSIHLVRKPLVIPGGEESKNNPEYVRQILDAVEREEIDRHSHLAVIGGGAVIDAAGYAAAIAHRGIRLIRIPTTVLAQNDASIGVKNGINAYGKKNFLGTFTPPYAVLNDFKFLETLEHRDWRSGIAEAIKVALIKDDKFFEGLESTAHLLDKRDMESMKMLIHRCAELHLEHIRTSGDPFETGSSRPLDFGHWAAHKLEQMTGYDIRHGEAVAIGIAVDVAYSCVAGMLSREDASRIFELFKNCGFDLYVPELEFKLDQPDHEDSILHGLEEFREHLGGELTIMLLDKIGKGVDVHKVDSNLYRQAVGMLKSYEKEPA